MTYIPLNIDNNTYQLEDSCNICKSSVFDSDIPHRMVRDHDHETGYIRGTLCEKCNSWLGVYESNKKENKNNGRKKFKDWVTQYKDRIEDHLNTKTEFIYKE